MKIGYGMNRDPQALREVGADRVYVDHKGSDRRERTALFTSGLRAGNVLLLLSRSDLGRGREIERFEALASDAGVQIQVVELPPPTRLKPGPKPRFQPTPEQRARCEHWWYGPFRRADALAAIKEIMGREVAVSQLNRHLGPRRRKQ